MIGLEVLFQGARTTIDGGWRISFDTHEGNAKQVTDISKLKDERIFLLIVSEEQFHELKALGDSNA